MIPDVGFAALRPYLAVVFGLIGNYLISRGFLEPSQLQPWVDGWIQIITATGSVLIGAIAVYHEFRLLMAKTMSKQTTTVTEKQTPTATTMTVETTPTAPALPLDQLYLHSTP